MSSEDFSDSSEEVKIQEKSQTPKSIPQKIFSAVFGEKRKKEDEQQKVDIPYEDSSDDWQSEADTEGANIFATQDIKYSRTTEREDHPPYVLDQIQELKENIEAENENIQKSQMNIMAELR